MVIISALKEKVDKEPNFEQQMSYYRKAYPSVYDLKFLQQNMFIIPVPFSKEQKTVLAHTKELMEYDTVKTFCSYILEA
jgi:hypothetical protein